MEYLTTLSVAKTAQSQRQMKERLRMTVTGLNRPSTTLSPTNLIQTELGSEPSLCSERPATDRLSHRSRVPSAVCCACDDSIVFTHKCGHCPVDLQNNCNSENGRDRTDNWPLRAAAKRQ